MERTRALEEPISPELVLVDRALAVQARQASADPPWLLPAVARQGVGVTPAVSIKEHPSPKAVSRRPRPSFSRHLRVTVVIGCAVVALVTVVSVALELVQGSAKPTLATRRAEPAAPPKKPNSTKGPQTARKTEPRPVPAKNPTRSPPAVSAPRPAAKPKAPAPVAFKRALTWRRARRAVYYQVHLQRGARIVYEVRTLKHTASIRLKLRPGRYHAVVRPAFATDAGIILGPEILDKMFVADGAA